MAQLRPLCPCCAVIIFAASERACMNSRLGVSPSSAKMQYSLQQLTSRSGYFTWSRFGSKGMIAWRIRLHVWRGFWSSKEYSRYQTKNNYVRSKQSISPEFSSIWIFAHGNLLICRSRVTSAEDHFLLAMSRLSVMVNPLLRAKRASLEVWSNYALLHRRWSFIINLVEE